MLFSLSKLDVYIHRNGSSGKILPFNVDAKIEKVNFKTLLLGKVERKA